MIDPLSCTYLCYLLMIVTTIMGSFIAEDLVFRDVDRFSQDSEVPFSGRYSRSYESSPKDFSPSSLSSDPSPSHLVLNRRTTCHKREFALTSNSEIVDRKHSFWDAHSIFHGLTFPVHGFRLAWKLVKACLRCTFIHLRSTQITLRSFISRVHKTLHGSSEDIGWLQRTPGLQPVEDGTTRFKELLCHIRNGDHTLPNTFVYLLIPGLFSNHSPLYFVSTKRFFSKMGLACHIAKIHSEASVEQNAWELKQYIEELYWGSGKRVLLLGHSKGGVDAAAALSLYWTKLKDKVGGLALVQSPYGGTPVASDILRDGQIADKEARWIMELLICKVIKGDMRALEDLTYDKRKEFLMKNKLPDQVPLVSFHTEASVSPCVLATLSHIAHAELPWLPIPYFGPQEQESSLGCRKIPVVIPVAAAMAVCALHLKLRYGEQSDGLVTRRDAEVPGSVVVRLDQKLDHAWMVYSSWKQDPIEPDASQMCEALLTMLVEIGKKKQQQQQQEQVGVDLSSS